MWACSRRCKRRARKCRSRCTAFPRRRRIRAFGRTRTARSRACCTRPSPDPMSPPKGEKRPADVSPDEAKAAGIEFKTGLFPFRANGRAMTLEKEAGFIRVVARADNHLLLGIQGVGAGIAELSAGFSLALEMGVRLEDLAATIHAHPTQSESLLEAALKALGHPMHI